MGLVCLFIGVLGIVLALVISKFAKSHQQAHSGSGSGQRGQAMHQNCPRCWNGIIHKWDGEFRCWDCGHVLEDDEVWELLDRIGQDQGGDAVRVWYKNSRGQKKTTWVDSKNVQVHGDKVTVHQAGSGGAQTLVRDRILNPEVLGLAEEQPPVLSGREDVLYYQEPSGEEFWYHVDANSMREAGKRVHFALWDGSGEKAFQRDGILNPATFGLEEPKPERGDDDEPPVLEPAEIFVGDVSGKELIYTRQDGRRGIIYFQPGTAEVIDNALYLQARVLLTPKGRTERYSILMENVINPEILFETDDPEPPPVPVPVSADHEAGMRVVLEDVPLDSYEAVKVMRGLQPTLSSFEIFEELRNERSTALQGLEESRAKDIQEDFQSAGCRVSLLLIEEGAQPAVVEPPPTVEPVELRPPTEEEFHEIRFGIDGNRATQLIIGGELDLNARDARGVPLLHGSMNPSLVDLLISYGANSRATDTAGNTALHNCPEDGVIAKLIDHRLNPDAINDAGQTPLHIWASQGQPGPVHALLTAEADASMRDLTGQTPLDLANSATFHNEEELDSFNHVIALLNEYTATEPELPPVIEEKLPPVIEEKLPPVVKAPSKGRKPKQVEFDTIRSALQANFKDAEKLVTSAKLDLNAKDEHSEPIFFGMGNVKILKLLAKHGVDLNATDNQGSNAWHDCARDVRFVDYMEMYEELLRHGVDVNARNNANETPLILATQHANFNLAKVLVENGADMHYKPESGWSALEIANHMAQMELGPQREHLAAEYEQISFFLQSHDAK